jgi:two-component system alkaline phosphatase synthesis response regulator PhoP
LDEKILVIQNKPKAAVALLVSLRNEGWVVDVARDGREGLDRALNEPFDLILLDLRRAANNGVNFCRNLRQSGLNTPILMLTPRTQPEDKVLGLKVGADDCVAKPFLMLELLARVEALLRRARSSPWSWGTLYHLGDIRVDLRRTQVWRRGKPVALSAREFQLLRYFIEHRGATLSRQELLKEVWGFDPKTSTRTVDVHVAGLRQKLEGNSRQPQLILTIQGLGYKLAAGTQPVLAGDPKRTTADAVVLVPSRP